MDNGLEQTRADSLIADEHDDPGCRCAPCERVGERRRAEERREDALARGGIAPWAHVLLGPGWVDGGTMGTTKITGMDELAQRAAGDAFAALARIGDRGRELAYPLYSVDDDGKPKSDAPRLTRGEALELVSAAELACDYARAIVDWLPRPANDVAGRLRIGDRVRFADADDGRAYTVIGKSGTSVVIERKGETLGADERDLRSVDEPAATAGAAT